MPNPRRRIVVIGGVAAGAKAAGRAKRVNRDAEITLLQDENEISYTACGLPYFLGNVIKNRDSLVIQKPASLRDKGINVLIRHRVEEIDSTNQCVTARNLENRQLEQFSFDRLIIATGAYPIVPEIPGRNLEGVVTLRSLSELDKFTGVLDKFRPRRAIIIGSGLIGIEVAENLSKLGISVSIVEMADRVMPRMDAEMSGILYEHLLKQRVKIILGESIVEIVGKGRVSAVITETGKNLEADLVVIAIGIRPNVQLAQDAGVELGSTGAISVNSRMETRIQNIYAAGDCSETVHRITEQPVWNPLGDIANLQGRVAGENAADGNAHFPGVFGTSIFKAFALNVAMTGLTEITANQANIPIVSVTISARDRARYYPGAKPLTLKLIANSKSGRVLGAQMIGEGRVDKMVDIIATALLGKLTCQDLESADFAYAPPFSPVLSPVIVAAAAICNDMKTRSFEAVQFDLGKSN